MIHSRSQIQSVCRGEPDVGPSRSLDLCGSSVEDKIYVDVEGPHRTGNIFVWPKLSFFHTDDPQSPGSFSGFPVEQSRLKVSNDLYYLNVCMLQLNIDFYPL